MFCFTLVDLLLTCIHSCPHILAAFRQQQSVASFHTLLQALVAALTNGAVPDLIYLDMRGNPLSEAGVTSLVSRTVPSALHCVPSRAAFHAKVLPFSFAFPLWPITVTFHANTPPLSLAEAMLLLPIWPPPVWPETPPVWP